MTTSTQCKHFFANGRQCNNRTTNPNGMCHVKHRKATPKSGGKKSAQSAAASYNAPAKKRTKKPKDPNNMTYKELEGIRQHNPDGTIHKTHIKDVRGPKGHAYLRPDGSRVKGFTGVWNATASSQLQNFDRKGIAMHCGVPADQAQSVVNDYNATRREVMAEGNKKHEAIEDSLKSSNWELSADPELAHYQRSAQDFLVNVIGVETPSAPVAPQDAHHIETEVPVTDTDSPYGGTIDCVVTTPDNRVIHIDWKTTDSELNDRNKPYEKEVFQGNAYAAASHHWVQDPFDEPGIMTSIKVDPPDEVWVVRIGPNGYIGHETTSPELAEPFKQMAHAAGPVTELRGKLDWRRPNPYRNSGVVNTRDQQF